MVLVHDYMMRDCADLDRVNSKELHECDVWAGYLGGAVEKVWSDADWKRVSDFPKLPIYGARHDKNGVYCGLEAIMAIYKLGIPHKTAVSADMEIFFPEGFTSQDLDNAITWIKDFHKVLSFFDYGVWPYGSTDYLFDLPVLGGYWVATDSKIIEQYDHKGVHATQYLFEDLWDDSLIHRHIVHAALAHDWGINH